MVHSHSHACCDPFPLPRLCHSFSVPCFPELHGPRGPVPRQGAQQRHDRPGGAAGAAGRPRGRGRTQTGKEDHAESKGAAWHCRYSAISCARRAHGHVETVWRGVPAGNCLMHCDCLCLVTAGSTDVGRSDALRRTPPAVSVCCLALAGMTWLPEKIPNSANGQQGRVTMPRVCARTDKGDTGHGALCPQRGLRGQPPAPGHAAVHESKGRTWQMARCLTV